MFECTVCGLHFISGASCPSCGSTIAKDLEHGEEMVNSDSESMPGLDDLAESIGDEPFEDETPQTIESASNLPFGMGAESSVSVSALPFGIGSNVSEVMDEESSIPTSILMDEGIIEQQPIGETEPVLQEQPEPVFHPEPALQEQPEPVFHPEPALQEDSEPVLLEEPEIIKESDYEQAPNKSQNEFEDVVPFEFESIEMEGKRITQTEVPVKLTATAIIESNSDLANSENIEDEVPQMWRIDAPEADMDSIYQEEERIVEVEFEDTFNVSEVAVDLDNIHQQVPEDNPEFAENSSPELHPARAMDVNTNGSPELDTYLAKGFDCMAESDWDQAARNFQRLAQQIPSDSAVLNNYGLALLQKAIQMEGSGDSNLASLSATQYESAIMALRQAAKIDPGKNDLILNLSHALLVSGRNEKSLGIIKVFRERQPNDVEGINIEASALLQLGRFDEARRLFNAASHDPLVKSNLERVPSTMS